MLVAQDTHASTQNVSVSVNLSETVGPYKPIYSWFGYDEGNYTTAPNGRRLLRELHDLSPVPVTIRVHHLLTSGNGVPDLKWSSTNVYSEDAQGKPIYNFTILDGIFDAFRDAGVRPMVELGFMPEALAANVPGRTQPYQVRYPASTISGSSNNPPKDFAKWGELCRVVTQHLVQRYGKEAVQQWYFEVWNEPDIDYWHASEQDYLKLYDYAVAGVRAALPGALVGGPATTGPRSEKAYAYLKVFLEHIRSGKSSATGQSIPLDFISFHAKGKPVIEGGHVTMGISNELNDVDRGFSLIAQDDHFRTLPIILSEADPEGCAACSSKVNPANNYRNGTLYPAYTAAAYKRLFDLQDKYGVNLISMLSWSFEFEGRDYFEGFRSLSTNGINKPILNFFRMAAMMKGNRVATQSSGETPLSIMEEHGVRSAPDVAAMATRDARQAAVMLWNYHDAAEGSPAAKVDMALHNIPLGVTRVRLTHYRIDATHSNAYTAWQKLGSPQHPTPSQVQALQAVQGLQTFGAPQWQPVTEGNLHLSLDMPAESVSLITLAW
ncbi:MAG: beta-xylosidase [Terriglobus sp.]